MLKHWYVRNFKSFKELSPIEMSMVNVLAGANSSGKSTLIQSILLLKQTLQYGAQDRPVALNGPLLRMGSFDDVCNNEAKGEDLRIALDFEIKPSEMDGGKPDWARSSSYSFQMKDGSKWQEVSLGLTYGLLESQGQKRTPTPTLLQTSLRLSGLVEEEPREELWNFTASSGKWPFDVSTSTNSELEVIENKPEGEIEGGIVSYFLPEIVVVKYNKTIQDVTGLVNSLFRPTTLLGALNVPDEPLSAEVVSLINEWLLEHNTEPLNVGSGPVLAPEAREKLSKFLPQPRYSINVTAQPRSNTDLDRLKSDVQSAFLSEREPEYRVTGSRSDGMDYALTYLTEFFRFGVRYLGPLRDNPRPVYQPDALESTTDVGYRGEHTAAVFEINKKAIVTYRRPPDRETEQDYANLAQIDHRPLEAATAEWLEYLGVASSVETEDAGVFGNSMRVSVDGAPLHYLTHVGVGVSQVLPIVIMALLAPRGSLLIFEQPELHLHPKVQARLADFFLALAIDGKQTLLETHSEYLVDRLRLRIAMSPDDNVRKLVNILFSEKKGGSSQLTPVEISEFGAIANWPSDFFEQSQQDVNKIVQAASRKRKNKIQRK